MTTDKEVIPKFSGYKLFLKEYFKEKKKKNEEVVLRKESHVVKQAWNALSNKEREKYRKRAHKLSRGQGKTYVVPFLTRCAPNQFMKVCDKIKNRPDRMERLEKIGFHKLVNICCAQIHRHLCGKFVDAFDPPTKNFSIRGKSLHVGPEDVNQMMGLPCLGGEIERKAKKDDKAFKSLKRSYGAIPYKMIGDWIIEGKVEQDFEILFVIFALGTLLCPGAANKVSDALLMVIVATKEDFRAYDWCTFVVNELCTSIGEYKKKVRKGKGTVSRKPIHIGGCIYFLMIYCLQNFPLGPLQAPTMEDAIHFWDDTKVKTRVHTERESNKGLLRPYGDVVGQSSTHPETVFTHPEIKRTYDRVMSRVMSTVTSIVQEELLALQATFLNGAEIDEADGDDKVQSDEEEPRSQNEEDEGDIQEEDEEIQSSNEDEGSDSEGRRSQKGEEAVENNEKNDDDLTVEEEFQKLRKSTRQKKPAIVSPWVVTTIGKKRTKTDDDKEALYQFCTTRCTKEEELEEFIAMHDYFLTRGELHCLRETKWINNRLMSMVGKTLVGDELQTLGHVRRHIFSTEFMEKMSNNPQRWSCEAHEKEILPDHIGYNIGDCDFIFGPTLHLNHWFCYVLETKTMRFYALDSYVDNITYLRLQNEEEEATKGSQQTKKPKRLTKTQEAEFKAKEWMASRCKDCFLKILRRVKPALFAKGRQIPDQVNWAKVHKQCDTDSCGVHVLSWLQQWDASLQDEEGYTMPNLSREQLRQVKIECLWWLVSHEKNLHAQKVLSRLPGNQKQRKKK